MNVFCILNWPIPDSLRNCCPVGIKHLKYEKTDIICVWFENNILIHDNVESSKLLEEKNSPEHSY
ncbi:hypothetical protein L9F63_021851, partial [Diploptera punctata]